MLLAAGVPVEEGDHALPPLEVGTQRGEYHRVRRWVRLQASGHLQQRRYTHRRLCSRCPRGHHRRRVVIRMDEHCLIPQGPRILPRHYRPHVVRHPLLPIHPPPQPHLYLSIYQPPPQPLSSRPLHPKARHIQRYLHVLALRLLRSSRIRSHKHHRPRPQRRGLQPSVLTGKVQHHHPPSYFPPIKIAPIPITAPNRRRPQPLRRYRRSPRPIRPHRVQRHRLTFHSNLPPRSIGTTNRKGVASRRQSQRLQPPLHILRRLGTPRIARYPRSQRGQVLHNSPRPCRSCHRADSKDDQKGNQRSHSVPISAPSIPSSKQIDGRGFFRH